MNPAIKNLLTDLYAADASLRQHESALIPLIERMLANRPNVAIDARFRQELRAKIVEAIAEREQRTAQAGSRRLIWALTGAAVCVVLAVPVVYTLMTGRSTKSSDKTGTLGTTVTTKRLAANAFGSLSSDSLTPSTSGGGGGGAPQAETATGARDVNSSEPTTILPVPGEYTVSAYNYVGAPLQLPGAKAAVYKRDKGFTDISGVTGLLRNIETGLVDLSKFTKSEVQSINFAENRPYGYSLYFDMVYGSVSISENWSTWPLLANPENSRSLTAADILSDDKLIAIADAFLRQYGVSRVGFGDPVVQPDPGIIAVARDATGEAAQSDTAYVPEYATVVYPVVINGTTAYDMNGTPYGLNVRVNVREKKVAAVDNLRSMNVESSDYAAVTEASDILAIAKRGGVYAAPYEQTPTSTLNYEIGTPEFVYTMMQSYSESFEEYFVPALRFPITKSPDNLPDYYQSSQAIVIPLVKDFLASDTTGLKIMSVNAGAAEGGGTAVIEPEQTPVNASQLPD